MSRLSTYNSIWFKVRMRDPTCKNWDETRSHFQRENPTTQKSLLVVSKETFVTGKSDFCCRVSARHQPPCVASGTYTKPRNIVQPPSLRGSEALLAHALTSPLDILGKGFPIPGSQHRDNSSFGIQKGSKLLP